MGELQDVVSFSAIDIDESRAPETRPQASANAGHTACR